MRHENILYRLDRIVFTCNKSSQRSMARAGQ